MESLISSKRSGILSSLATQNMTLKIALTIMGALIGVETIGLVSLAFKKPLVVAIEGNQPRVLSATLNDDGITVSEIRAFLVEMLARKYPKIPNLETQKSICGYFAEGLKEACEKELNAKKLLIPQDFVVEEIAWEEKSNRAQLKLKRYATFNGTISSVDSSIALHVEKRRRTPENPWGIYISQWKEEVQK